MATRSACWMLGCWGSPWLAWGSIEQLATNVFVSAWRDVINYSKRIGQEKSSLPIGMTPPFHLLPAYLHFCTWFHHDMWGAHQTRCLTFRSFSRSSHLGSCHGSELEIFPTRKGSWTLWWRVAPWLRGSSVRFLLTSPCEWAVCDGHFHFQKRSSTELNGLCNFWSHNVRNYQRVNQLSLVGSVKSSI